MNDYDGIVKAASELISIENLYSDGSGFHPSWYFSLKNALSLIEQQKAEITQLKAACHPTCPSCGLENNRIIHNIHCDRCGGILTQTIKEGEGK